MLFCPAETNLFQVSVDGSLYADPCIPLMDPFIPYADVNKQTKPKRKKEKQDKKEKRKRSGEEGKGFRKG